MVSFFVAAVAMALVKQEKGEAAEAKKTEEEFSWIVKVLKKREDSEVSSSFSLASYLLQFPTCRSSGSRITNLMLVIRKILNAIVDKVANLSRRYRVLSG